MNYTILFFLIVGVIIGIVKDIMDPGEGVPHSNNMFTFMCKDKYKN